MYVGWDVHKEFCQAAFVSLGNVCLKPPYLINDGFCRQTFNNTLHTFMT